MNIEYDIRTLGMKSYLISNFSNECISVCFVLASTSSRANDTLARVSEIGSGRETQSFREREGSLGARVGYDAG